MQTLGLGIKKTNYRSLYINTEKISLKIKTELKLKSKYIYRGRKMDSVGKGIEAAEIKDKDAAPSKLEKEIGG